LEVYIYANYVGPVIDRKSILYCMFLGENFVTWRSKKQNVVVRSSTEAEFQAMTNEMWYYYG